MDEDINRMIVITDYPFSQQYYDYFGFELLRNRGIEVEIWDITSCLHQKFASQLNMGDNENIRNLQRFTKKTEIIKAISTLDKKSIISCFIGYNHSTFFIFRAISQNKIKYCVFRMASFPSPDPVQDSFFGRVVSLPKKALSLKIFEIFEHIINKILLNYYFIFGIAPASIIFLGGEKSAGCLSYPIGKATVRLWTHGMDYNIYLQNKDELSNPSEKTGVFLDEYIPFHPDCLFIGIDFPISHKDYYPKICSFFQILEKSMTSQVLIAAHPKSEYPNLPEDYFCGRKIIKGQTARLVKESSFVIAHMSTAINFAVLFHKPLVLITTDKLQNMVSGKNITGSYIQAIASELGKQPINIDHISGFNWEKEMTINEEAYLRYRNNYIKKQGTPEKHMWEIFYFHIKHKSIS